MLVFDVIQPGTWINCTDHKKRNEISGQLMLMQTSFFDANISLNLFNESMSEQTPVSSIETQHSETALRQQIELEISKEYADPYSFDSRNEISLKVDQEYNRRKWKSGIPPSLFENRKIFLFAKAFINCLDVFHKSLSVLSNLEGSPEKLTLSLHKFEQHFSNLRRVRNTEQHQEDRIRGFGAGKKPKPMDLKPIQNKMISSDAGVLALGNLNGTKYGSTMADGHYGEIDISENSMNVLSDVYKEVLNSFEWTGPKTLLPR